MNLLRPARRARHVVAIDWAFRCQLPLGHDLGQLLAGEVERGRMDAGAAARAARGVEPAYVAGLAAEGLDADRAHACAAGWCAARSDRGRCPARSRWSTSTSPTPTSTGRSCARRAGLGRFALDLVLG